MSAWAIVVAAGRGARMGAAVNKVFLRMGGRSVLRRCVEAVSACEAVEGIVVVAAAQDLARAREELRGCDRVREVVAGGATRQDSVWNGLGVLPEACDIVLVHDAARANVTAELVGRCVEAVRRYGACVACVPVTDTIKVVDSGSVVRTLDRASLMAAQTPQGFRRRELVAAYEAARADGFLGTDDASVLEHIGREVRVIEGSERNWKLTTPGDWERMRGSEEGVALLSSGEGGDRARTGEDGSDDASGDATCSASGVGFGAVSGDGLNGVSNDGSGDASGVGFGVDSSDVSKGISNDGSGDASGVGFGVDSSDVSKGISNDGSGDASGAVFGVVSSDVSNGISNDGSGDASGAVFGVISSDVSNGISNDGSGDASGAVFGVVSSDVSNGISNDGSGSASGAVSGGASRMVPIGVPSNGMGHPSGGVIAAHADPTSSAVHPAPPRETRVGQGFDAHRLVEGRRLVLCGVVIPHDKGLLGHSDADVATHALMDALLGAACLGDIGALFPDSDAQYKGADSVDLLRRVVAALDDAGWRPGNVDVTIVAQRPKVSPHRDAMRARLAEALGVAVDAVSVKATTTEGMGFPGKGVGIAALAVATVVR